MPSTFQHKQTTMGFESFPGIKGMALNFMMDNGLMDDAPKQALARFAPGAKDSGGPLVQQLSIAQTSPAGKGLGSHPEGGAGMTSFERESREASANPYQSNQQTQSEAEMRESARSAAGSSMPGQGNVHAGGPGTNEVRGAINRDNVVQPGPKYRKRNEREVRERMRQLDAAVYTGSTRAGLAGAAGVVAGAAAQGGYALGREGLEGWVRDEDIPAYENWDPEDIRSIVD